VAFAVPGTWKPSWVTASDTIYAELINDTIDANIVSISGDAGAADSLEYLLDGTGANLWIDKLRAGAYWTADTADTVVKMVGIVVGNYTYAGLYGTYTYGGDCGTYAYGDNYGTYTYGGFYGTYSHGGYYGLLLRGATAAIHASDSRETNLRIDYCDTVDYIPEVSASGDTNLFNMSTLATSAELTTAQDSIVSAIGSDSDSARIAALLDSMFFDTNAGSLYVHGGYIDTVTATIAVIGTVLANIYYDPLWWGLTEDEIELLIDSESNTDIDAFRGDDKTWDITITDATGEASDISGATLVLELAEGQYDSSYVIVDTLTIIDGGLGTAQMTLSAAQTSSLVAQYYWGWIRYYSAGGARSTLWNARLKINY
jgi:hypothetical protein